MLGMFVLPAAAATGTGGGGGGGSGVGISCGDGFSYDRIADPFGLIHNGASMRQTTHVPHFHLEAEPWLEDVHSLIVQNWEEALIVYFQYLVSHLQWNETPLCLFTVWDTDTTQTAVWRRKVGNNRDWLNRIHWAWKLHKKTKSRFLTSSIIFYIQSCKWFAVLFPPLQLL